MSDVGKVIEKTAKGGFLQDLLKPIEQPFRTGKTAAKRSQQEQTRLIGEQTRKEKQRLDVAEGDVLRRRASASRGRKGRQSLIATSPTGLATNLGGTSNGSVA